MKIRKTKDSTATLYFFRIKDLEKKLGDEKRGRKKAETQLDRARRENEELKRENGRLKNENENLLNCRKTYARMLFKGNKQKTAIKKCGRPEGHPGTTRVSPCAEQVTEEKDLTLEICPDCKSALFGCKRIQERIIEDISVCPVTVITRYRIRHYECKNCGAKPKAASNEIVGNSPFGRKTFAAILFHRYRMNTPLHKIAEILKEIHGLTISTGGIQGLLAQAAREFGPKYEELKQLLIDGKIIHADETGWRVNGKNWWTWLWSNGEAVVYITENTRGKGIPEKALEGFRGVLHRDGYGGYNGIDTEQQVCWVHCLRKAHEYCERMGRSREMVRLKNMLKALYRRMSAWHTKKHSSGERLEYHSRMKEELAAIRENEWKEKDARTFIRAWLIRHKERLVTFLKYPYARPENNTAERDLRPRVVQRKISGGSRSAKAVKAADINMSVIQTWAKQGFSLMQNMPVFGLSP